jgi:hypothetical protein
MCLISPINISNYSKLHGECQDMNEHFIELYKTLDKMMENADKQIDSSGLTVELKQEGKSLVRDLGSAVERMKLNLNNLQNAGGIVGNIHHTDGEVLRASRQRLEQWLVNHCSSGLVDQ